ncbi:hypothetical protein LFX15_16335 [Leptospira levettii]|uniref:hypothetical protein n=1 Tax=Leptospira levettii TaxID=2023178 RepID=UPI001EEB168E|nr:hypothetical protein [Leptospira levettii]MCG6149869.1 hypothetical protein [Leptospira levettii]MCW7475095.1 hypothetical protein [Leptospira levettii]
MSPTSWKDILIKEKEVCNQIIFTARKLNPQFTEDDVSHHLVLFFDSLYTNLTWQWEEGEVVSLFETFVRLLSKQFLQRLGNFVPLYYQIIKECHPNLKQSPNRFIPYLSNAISKVEDGKKELYLKRCLSLLPKIQTLEEFKIVLGVLYWASGKPEYREVVKSLFPLLGDDLKTECKKILGIDETSIQSPFVPTTQNQTPKGSFHFRSIPGYTLFGGTFTTVPKLYGNLGNVLVSSGESWYQLFVDEFGTSLYSIEPPMSPTITSSPTSNIWKQILTQKLDPNSISSSIEKESYALYTLKHSYQLYLFYMGRT